MFGEVLGNVEDPNDVVRQAHICVCSEFDLKNKDLTFQRVNFSVKLLQP